MKLAIMQPYFFPYIGYFQLIKAVDRFIIFDDVQYIERGWIHRNRILLNGEPTYINLPIKKAPRDTLINQRELAAHEMARYKDKTLAQLRMTYKKMPYFEQVTHLVDAVLSYPETNIALFLANSLRMVCDYLAIDTPMTSSSSIALPDNSVRAQERIISLCKVLQADQYINSIGGQALYRGADFVQENIKLQFIKCNDIVYQQPAPIFVPHLSIIDVMMCNSLDDIRQMLNNYQLVE